jgi:hypothetical protein
MQTGIIGHAGALNLGGDWAGFASMTCFVEFDVFVQQAGMVALRPCDLCRFAD